MRTYSLADLFDGVVAVGFAAGMRTEEERLGFAMVESHETVLPIANVVAEANVQDDVTQVEAVEVEPEGVDYTISLVHHQEHGWCFAAAPGLPFLDGMALVPFAQLPVDSLGISIAGTEIAERLGG